MLRIPLRNTDLDLGLDDSETAHVPGLRIWIETWNLGFGLSIMYVFYLYLCFFHLIIVSVLIVTSKSRIRASSGKESNQTDACYEKDNSSNNTNYFVQ